MTSCFVQVAQRSQKMIATCKSSSDYVEHTECCKTVQSVWDTLELPVELRDGKETAKMYVHEEAPVVPAEFVVPSERPANTILYPSFVERHRLAADPITKHIALYPAAAAGAAATVEKQCFHDRSATVWGQWGVQSVQLHTCMDDTSGQRAHVTGQEYGIFPINTVNFVDISVMYDWWSLTRRSGMRLHCMYEYVRDKYETMAPLMGRNKTGAGRSGGFMNKRLWYTACYKFVASLDIMEHTLDPQVDLCVYCGTDTPFSICMDGCCIPCDKRKLTEKLLKQEKPHGDEEECGFCQDHGLNIPDGVEEQEDSDNLGQKPMDHSLPLSINARNLQQHLFHANGNELHWSTKDPFTVPQRAELKQLAAFAKSFSKKNPSVTLTDAQMTSLLTPLPPTLLPPVNQSLSSSLCLWSLSPSSPSATLLPRHTRPLFSLSFCNTPPATYTPSLLSLLPPLSSRYISSTHYTHDIPQHVKPTPSATPPATYTHSLLPANSLYTDVMCCCLLQMQQDGSLCLCRTGSTVHPHCC